jgi:hypothetical protein
MAANVRDFRFLAIAFAEKMYASSHYIDNGRNRKHKILHQIILSKVSNSSGTKNRSVS